MATDTRANIHARLAQFTTKIIDSQLLGEKIKLRQPSAWDYIRRKGDSEVIEMLLLCAETAEGVKLFDDGPPTDPFTKTSDRQRLAAIPMGHLMPAAADVMRLVWEDFEVPEIKEEPPITDDPQPPSPN